MAKRKAEWKLCVGGRTSDVLRRLVNGSWIRVTSELHSDGSNINDARYVDVFEAARLLHEAGYDLDGTGLDDFSTDEIETDD